MDSKNKFLNIIFAIFSYPIYCLSVVLIHFNLFDFKADFIRISAYKNKNVQVPSIIHDVLVAGEDHRFYLHYGFDPISILRAVWNVFIKKNRQGGSTIEQQVVRTITNRYEVTFSRKVREILLAAVLKNIFTKKEIINVYLSIAYFGWSMNGVNKAFFRMKIINIEITLNQACSLIARLKYPEPKEPSKKTIQRINNRSSHIFQKVNNRSNLEINPAKY
jgi:membrane peptidoglycan carboxypeptidase